MSDFQPGLIAGQIWRRSFHECSRCWPIATKPGFANIRSKEYDLVIVDGKARSNPQIGILLILEYEG
jgi:hypothetical protein